MGIDLAKTARADAIASIERYFRENMDEPIGSLGAGVLLDFFLAEVGPSIYNKGVADAQAALQARVAELDFEVHQDEFQYWSKADQQRKRRS
jgi:uncharacterized protein (DUF2164 family)